MSRNYPFSCYSFADSINKKGIVLPLLNEQTHKRLKLQSPNEALDDLGSLTPFMDVFNHDREKKVCYGKTQFVLLYQKKRVITIIIF